MQRILGLPSRYDTDAFLEEAGADLGYTLQDLEEDLCAYRQGVGAASDGAGRERPVNGPIS